MTWWGGELRPRLLELGKEGYLPPAPCTQLSAPCLSMARREGWKRREDKPDLVLHTESGSAHASQHLRANAARLSCSLTCFFGIYEAQKWFYAHAQSAEKGPGQLREEATVRIPYLAYRRPKRNVVYGGALEFNFAAPGEKFQLVGYDKKLWKQIECY